MENCLYSSGKLLQLWWKIVISTGSIISTGHLFCLKISIISTGFINKSSENSYYKYRFFEEMEL